MKDKKNKNADKISFDLRFVEIKVLKYSQFDVERQFDPKATPLVEFQSNFQFRVIPQDQMVGCQVTVKLIIIETKEEFAELKIENLFEIKPFDSIIKAVSPGNFEIPDGIIITIASISASTVRGILFEKLKGSIVQREVYPLIDIASLLAESKKSVGSV